MLIYTPPEIIALGNALLLVEGSKSNGLEPPTGEPNGTPECELDD